MTDNPYAVPRTFTVYLKPCGCGVLLGEHCDCVGPTPKVADAENPSVTIFALVDGRLQAVTDTMHTKAVNA